MAAFVLLFVGGVAFWLKPWIAQDESASVGRQVSPLPDKPSIAVLPFDNLSGDPEQEYFSDGVSEDIITDLSRLSNLAVIARNSSFTYKGTAVKVQQIGQDLGVQFLLEGSVRKPGSRIRITAQLVETTNGHHLWAKRYDRELTDIFALQDEITGQIVSALSIQLSEDEKRNIGRVNANSFEAYDLFLQAQSEAGEQTLALYWQAIDLDPGFARAYGALSVALMRKILRGDTDSPMEMRERALVLARKAVSIDVKSPHALWALGFAYMVRKQFSEAIETLERAVSLSPSYADGYGLLALIKNNMGQAEEAIELIEKGIALNPYYTWDYPYNLGRANYALGNYKIAIQYLLQALERNPAVLPPKLYLAGSYVQLGEQEEAEWVIAELEMQRPDYKVSHLRKILPISDENLRNRLFGDLITAGLSG